MIITLCRRGLLKVYASFCELNISFYKTLTFRFVHYIRDVSDCLYFLFPILSNVCKIGNDFNSTDFEEIIYMRLYECIKFYTFSQ